jgi:hypothetical protein
MEEIQVNTGIEQKITITYGSEELTFELFFDDYFNLWFLNLSNAEGNLLKGLTMPLGVDVFEGQGLPYGKLMLIDDGEGDLNMKTDLGTRIKLVRDV